MTRISFLPDERRLLYSPIALMIRDALTGEVPLGRVTLKVERQVSGGGFEEIPTQPSVSSQGIWSFPGLGRSVSKDHSPQKHRISVTYAFYEALPAIELDVHHYDDQKFLDDSKFAKAPRPLFAIPNDKYPFPKNLPVVRGRVVKADGSPANGIEVSHNSNPTVKTDETGFFSLDIRWPPAGTWPPADTVLRRSSIANSQSISVNNTAGIAAGGQVELVEDFESSLAVSAAANQNTILVTQIDAFDESADVILETSVLPSFQRRFEIAAGGINTTSGSITLKRNLPNEVGANTSVFQRSSRFKIESVSAVDRRVNLTDSLGKRWGRGTRVVRFSKDLELDINDEIHPLPIPDGFRFFEIQLKT